MHHRDRTSRGALPRTPSDELVLAAVERAERHRPRPGAPASLRTVLEHLAIAGRSAAGRSVADALERMKDGGWVKRSRAHGRTVWGLTAGGRGRLAGARRGGRLDALPDSPQHRAWLQARTAAAQEMKRFRADVRAALAEAEALLDDAPAGSDLWFEAGAHLGCACRRLGSACHCLYEWEEPEDDRADLDSLSEDGEQELPDRERSRRRALRAGRRNIRLWRENG